MKPRDIAAMNHELAVRCEAAEVARDAALERINELEVELDWLRVVSTDEARDEALRFLREKASFLLLDRNRWRERAWTETARRLGEPGLWEAE